ncbi:hypothetical protein HD554DRAFT_2174164 [Boletus coccyginus]|nr:hypothetical protein HD554DRAFT_2174164 [Boletus coccyginus]
MDIWSMTLSSNYDLGTSGDKRITIRALCGILPDYFDNIPRTRETIQKLRNKLAESQYNLIESLRAQEESFELRNGLAKSQRAANEQKDSLIEIIGSLRADLHTPETNSNQKIVTLNKVVRELRDKKESPNETSDSPRADLRTRDESSSALLVQLANAQCKTDGLIRINRAHEQKYQCKSLYTQGHICGATEYLL